MQASGKQAQPIVPNRPSPAAGRTPGARVSGAKKPAAFVGGVVLKMLVSNALAGTIIGKGGASIRKLQADNKAKVNLSQAGRFFPGTEDRVVMIEGATVDIVAATHAQVLRLVVNEGATAAPATAATESAAPADAGATEDAPAAATTAARVEAKVSVPNTVAGAFIGKQGVKIRAFMETTGCLLQFSQKDDHANTCNERILHINGTLAQVGLAVMEVLRAMTADPDNGHYSNLSTNYTLKGGGHLSMFTHQCGYPPSHEMANMGMGGMGGGPPPQFNTVGVGMGMGNMGGIGGMQLGVGVGAHQLRRDTTIHMAVPDAMVGAICGKGGAVIKEIQQYSGTCIKISQKGEFVPGSQNRTLTISGSVPACQTAQFMVSQKMQEAAAQTFGLANVGSPQLATYGTMASTVMAAGAGSGMGGFGGNGTGGGGMNPGPPMGGGFGGGGVPDGSGGIPNMGAMGLGPGGGAGPMGNGMPGGHDLRVNELASVRAGHDLSLAGMGRMAQHMADSPARPAQGFPGVGDGPWG